jgi:hypothetical protein
MINKTYCENDENGEQICEDFLVCGEELSFDYCGEDYQWECGDDPVCQIVPKGGNSGSSASSGVSSPSCSTDNHSSAPGGSCGAKGSSGSSLNTKCSEQDSGPLEEDVAEIMGMRVTRAFLGISGGQGGWWNILQHTWEIVGNPSRFYHTALWLGTDRTLGFLLHYGAYYPRDENDSRAFFEGSGAHFKIMNIRRFELEYSTFPIRELKVKNPMTFREVWEGLKRKGPWTVEAYGWLRHNCQHFTDRVGEILQLEIYGKDIGNPKEIPVVLKALQSTQ